MDILYYLVTHLAGSPVFDLFTGTGATLYAFGAMLNLLLKVLLSVWAFHGLYVLVMGFYRAKLNGKLTPVATALAYPWLAIGYVVDVAMNMTVAMFLFLELPKEGLVTSRLQRHLRTTPVTEWRYKVAYFICTQMLDYFDPNGKHC